MTNKLSSLKHVCKFIVRIRERKKQCGRSQSIKVSNYSRHNLFKSRFQFLTEPKACGTAKNLYVCVNYFRIIFFYNFMFKTTLLKSFSKINVHSKRILAYALLPRCLMIVINNKVIVPCKIRKRHIFEFQKINFSLIESI